MEPIFEKQEVKTVRQPDLIIKYGKTTYRLSFHFAERGKLSMNDKVLKLIRAHFLSEPNIVQ